MKSLSLIKVLAGALAVGGVIAHAETIATFADPSPSGDTPVFTFTSAGGAGTLSGGWNGLGLTLQTPGLAAPDFADAQFTMPAVAATGGLGVWTLGTGSVNFFDSANNPLFTISFDSGVLTSPVGTGASDFVGNNVTFSGPIIPAGVLLNEAFAFSFANPRGTMENYTATSAFTSSADRIPEPSSLALLALGSLVTLVRRR